MGKIRSAIITTFLVLVLIVGALFATVTFGANSVNPLNSVLSMIPLGSEFTGNAETTIYPEGVITASQYNKGVEGDPDFANDYVEKNGFYFEKDVYETVDMDSVWNDTVEKVASDAKVMAKRFGNRTLTSNSVSVVNDIAIHVSIPTTYCYAQYMNGDKQSFANDPGTVVNSIFEMLTYSGEMSLRHVSVGYNDDPYETGSKSLVSRKEDVTDMIKSVTRVARGQTYALKFNLSSEGKKLFETQSTTISTESDTNIYVYVGKTQTISIPATSVISDSFYITVGYTAAADEYVRTCVALFSTVTNGEYVQLNYNFNSENISYMTAETGSYTALITALAFLVMLVAVSVFFIVKYNKLGIVAMLNLFLFAEALVYIAYLTGIVVTFASIMTAVVGLALYVGCTIFTYESIRRQTTTGKTIVASIKAGYQDVMTTMIDIHVVLLITALFMILIGVAEVSICGVVLMVATLTSYVLHWVTRYIWYIMSAPAKDKFKFCKFKKVVYEDD